MISNKWARFNFLNNAGFQVHVGGDYRLNVYDQGSYYELALTRKGKPVNLVLSKKWSDKNRIPKAKLEMVLSRLENLVEKAM